MKYVVLLAALAAALGVASRVQATPAYSIAFEASGAIYVTNTSAPTFPGAAGLYLANGYNPCWCMVRLGSVSGGAVAFQKSNGLDLGIYRTDFTLSPLVISSPSTVIDWAGSDEKDPDWIPSNFPGYVAFTTWAPGEWAAARTDPGQLLFVSNATGYYQVYKKTATGVSQLTFSATNKSHPTWSNQGASVVYADSGVLRQMSSGGGGSSVVATGNHPSGDPNSGGIPKFAWATPYQFIYDNGSSLVLTNPVGFSQIGDTPTADFDGAWFAWVNRSYIPWMNQFQVTINTWFRNNPAGTPGSGAVTLPMGLNPSVDPDLVGLYTEPEGPEGLGGPGGGPVGL